ncbi:MAG: hypothetical protein D6B25_17985 [Desulfobulbaceae bacterium]|nr:MAG: hypothetical protein D6B25_17985 [Desulfobulbaceae bacterium]
MGWEKIYSLEKLISKGRSLQERYDVFSFDLFDTLFIRRIHDPDLIKHPVARYIANLARQHGISKSWEFIQKRRDEIEQHQRMETAQKFADHEACYPVFMERLLRELFSSAYDPNLLEKVTSYELDMEQAMLVPRSRLIEWLEELHGLGKRILIISDIYLPAAHLKRLTERAGFQKYAEDLISSADTYLAKASGEGFRLVEDKFQLDKDRWIHIGDNPISDGLRAHEAGLNALVIHDPGEKHRKAIMKRYINYAKGKPFYRGRALQQLMLPHEGENVERSELYLEGYNFLGPLMGGLVQEIAEQSRERNITKLFFLSREGYTFKKVWEKSTPLLFPDQELPETEYLYVSRMALAGASCAHEGLTRSDISIAFLPPGNRDFRDVARIFQLDIEKLLPHLDRYQLYPDTCLTPRHTGFNKQHQLQLMELLDDQSFQEEIKVQTEPANRALMHYLESVDFFSHERVGIIDIGWLGTIQRFLYNSVKHREDCPVFHGYLFAATRGVEYPADNKNDISGVIYDRNRFDLAASTILYARDVFEEACRAPHPTLNGYDLTEDGFSLRFRTERDEIGQAEKEQDNYFAPLQEGIIDAAERYGAASALLGRSMADYRPWFNYCLATKLAFPTSREVATIRHKHHLDDFHGAHTPDGAKHKTPRQLWDASRLNLCLNPFLRIRFFWRHIKDVVRN